MTPSESVDPEPSKVQAKASQDASISAVGASFTGVVVVPTRTTR